MDKDNGTGWERNNRTLFDDIVMNYDKVRWEYPDKLFADIIQYSRPDKGRKALEIESFTPLRNLPVNAIRSVSNS